MVAVKGLTKRYPGVVALNGATLDLYGGEVLGLIGKNGAGKSSLIKVLAGGERPDEGEVLDDACRSRATTTPAPRTRWAWRSSTRS